MEWNIKVSMEGKILILEKPRVFIEQVVLVSEHKQGLMICRMISKGGHWLARQVAIAS